MDAPDETRAFARQLRKAMSLPEVLLWKAIRNRKLNGLRFRRQYPLGPYVLDFYCPEFRICVEVDGASHSLGDRPQKDDARDAWLAAKGVRTLRLSASLILDEVDDATRTILAFAFPDAPPGGGAVVPDLIRDD